VSGERWSGRCGRDCAAGSRIVSLTRARARAATVRIPRAGTCGAWAQAVVRRGKTPVLTQDQAMRLLERIDASTLVGLRDRALIGVMIYRFARIGAVVGMKVEDYYPGGKRWWVRLHEKGGKRHEMPAHHKLEAFIDEYLAAAGIREDGKAPFFRSAIGKTGVLTDKPMNRIDAYRMVRRRTADAGFKVKLGCHVFRATGITAYLEAGGSLDQGLDVAAYGAH
jgi:integrase/recombinase XerD